MLVVGETNCPALRQTLAACGPLWHAVYERSPADARRRLARGESFDATLLLAEQPRSVDAKTPDLLAGAGEAGAVVTVAGPWFEGALRQQDRAGDRSVVYWCGLVDWLHARFGGDRQQAEGRSTEVVLVSSRDRDAATAIADALASETPTAPASVVWLPRGGRAPFISRGDAGVWVGGQLDGAAAVELASFVERVRAFGGRVVALLDFPRHDEIVTAEALGAVAVLAKPWEPAVLWRTLRPMDAVGREHRRVPFLRAA